MTDERSSHKENENDACEGCVENLSLNRKRELIVAEFKRKHKVRSIFRDFPVDELSEIVDRLKGVLDERIKEEAEREAKEAEKQARASGGEIFQGGKLLFRVEGNGALASAGCGVSSITWCCGRWG